MTDWRTETIGDLEREMQVANVAARIHGEQATAYGIGALLTAIGSVSSIVGLGFSEAPPHLIAYLVLIPAALAIGWRVTNGRANECNARASELRDQIGRLSNPKPKPESQD